MPLPDPGPLPDPRDARASVGEIEGLRDDLWSRGVAKVLLAGAGGVGVVAEALAGEGARLTVLDGCDPVQLADALDGDLDATVLVVSAPPGADSTAVELVWDEVVAAFTADGLDPADHTVLVAPPDHPLVARAAGAPVVPGPAHLAYPGSPSHPLEPVRGRRNLCEVGAWAAFTPYALVPAGLAGADVGALLREAASPGAGGPALQLGERLDACEVVALAGPMAEVLSQLVGTLAGPGPTTGLSAHTPRRALAHPADEVPEGHPGCASGPLILTVDGPGAPGSVGPLTLTVGPGGAGVPAADVPTTGSPAAQLLLWQRAVAYARGVRAAAAQPPRARPAATAPPHDHTPVFVDGAVEIRAPWPVTALADALAQFLAEVRTLAVHAHLDRHDDASAALLRSELTARTGLLTAFGWGARTVPIADAVLQITGAGPVGPAAARQRATAEAEAGELERRGIRVLRLHLTDRLLGLVELMRAVQELRPGTLDHGANSPNAPT